MVNKSNEGSALGYVKVELEVDTEVDAEMLVAAKGRFTVTQTLEMKSIEW